MAKKGSSPTPTTVKIPGPLHARLMRASERTKLKKPDVLRLCVELAMPKIEAQFAQMKGEGVGEVGLAVRVDPKQLGELRELYKSAVTDELTGLEDLEGATFVAAAEKKLREMCSDDFQVKLSEASEARIRRFLSVYAQLF